MGLLDDLRQTFAPNRRGGEAPYYCPECSERYEEDHDECPQCAGPLLMGATD